MRVRIRGPDGQTTINLAATATTNDLVKEISKATGLTKFEIRSGFPPKLLPLDDYSDKQTPLLNLPFNLDGESLTVSKRAGSNGSSAAASTLHSGVAKSITSTSTATSSQPKNGPTSSSTTTGPLSLSRKPAPTDTPEIPVPSHEATMVLRVMPDDNSCLFRAFSSAFLGSAELDSMHELRAIIASTIQADPLKFNAVVLEKEPDDYCRWIQTADAWGGGIELGILAEHFEVEIASIDVQTNQTTFFRSEVKKPGKRVMLVYSGIHYDVIALSPSQEGAASAGAGGAGFAGGGSGGFGAVEMPPEFDRKVFDIHGGDALLLEHALQLCSVLRDQNYFTDTHGFLLRCEECGYMATGQEEAREHGRMTGHEAFQEAD